MEKLERIQKSLNPVRYSAGAVFASMFLCLLYSYSSSAQKQGQARIDSFLRELHSDSCRNKEDTNKAFLLYRLGYFYAGIDPDQGARFAAQGRGLAQKLNWEHGVAEADNIMGACYMYKSDFAKSLQYWDEAMNIFGKLNDKKGTLKVVGNIGNVYNLKSDFPRSQEYYFLALKYAEEINDKNSIAINLSNIGANYESMKDYKNALEYGLKALAINEGMHDTLKTANCQNNIGNVYSDQGNYQAALRYDLSALKYYSGLGNNEGVITTMNNIGIVYSGLGNYAQALEYHFRSLKIAQKTGFIADAAISMSLIGQAYLLIAKSGCTKPVQAETGLLPPGKIAVVHKSIEYIEQSIDSLLLIGRLDYLTESYKYLSEAQAMAGDFKGALESHEQYMVFKDSVYASDNKIKIANLETQREIDLKDKQIEIDRLENRNKDKQIELDKLDVARKRNERVLFIAGIVLLLAVIAIVYRNLRLRAAKQTSEYRLSAFQARMNPHFIFNSLNSIQSLVLKNETISSIKYLSEFSKLMRQILDNSVKSKVPLKIEIQMLRSYIELEHLRFDCFSWDISIAQNVLADSAEVPGMIIQPFVENAIIHGLVPKGENGALLITFERDGNQIVCTVEDNGIGRAKSYELNRKREKDRQSHGVDIATNRLALLNNKKNGLVNQVIYFDKEEYGIATGTKVIIQIPVL